MRMGKDVNRFYSDFGESIDSLCENPSFLKFSSLEFTGSELYESIIFFYIVLQKKEFENLEL